MAKGLVFIVPGDGTSLGNMTPDDILAWQRQQQMDNLFIRFCNGSGAGDGPVGCGRGQVLPDSETGATIFVARDDSLRSVQLCTKLTGNGAACLSSDNPLSPNAPDDAPALDALLADRITAGARISDTDGITKNDRLATGRGQRTLEAGTVSRDVGSQWRRGCQKTFKRDSLKATDRAETLVPARNRLLKCLLAGGETTVP
jgi:hypothetical protein